MYNLKTINKKISEILDRIDLAKSNNNDRKVIEYINALEEAEDIKEGILEIAALETKQMKKMSSSDKYIKQVYHIEKKYQDELDFFRNLPEPIYVEFYKEEERKELHKEYNYDFPWDCKKESYSKLLK